MSGRVNESCLTICSFIKLEKGGGHAWTGYRTLRMLVLPCRSRSMEGAGSEALGKQRGGSRVPRRAGILGTDLSQPPGFLESLHSEESGAMELLCAGEGQRAVFLVAVY